MAKFGTKKWRLLGSDVYYQRDPGIWYTPCLMIQWHDLRKGVRLQVGAFSIGIWRDLA